MCERDETDYSALFESPQSGQVILGNIVNSTFTGVISASAKLEFYPTKHERRQDDPARTPDQVLPLVQSNAQGGINEPAFLFTARRPARHHLFPSLKRRARLPRRNYAKSDWR